MWKLKRRYYCIKKLDFINTFCLIKFHETWKYCEIFWIVKTPSSVEANWFIYSNEQDDRAVEQLWTIMNLLVLQGVPQICKFQLKTLPK